MSKQDSKFFNIFSLVLGILIVITVVLFAMARSVGVPLTLDDFNVVVVGFSIVTVTWSLLLCLL